MDNREQLIEQAKEFVEPQLAYPQNQKIFSENYWIRNMMSDFAAKIRDEAVTESVSRSKLRADIQERLGIAKEFRDEEQDVQTRAYLDGQVYVLGRILSDIEFGLWAHSLEQPQPPTETPAIGEMGIHTDG